MQSFIIQAAGEEELNPLIPHTIEIILSLVVFGLLFFAVKKWVVPSFEKTFAERTAAIEGGLAAAETKQAEADAKLADLEEQLANARHEAARIREDARQQGAHPAAPGCRSPLHAPVPSPRGPRPAVPNARPHIFVTILTASGAHTQSRNVHRRRRST